MVSASAIQAGRYVARAIHSDLRGDERGRLSAERRAVRDAVRRLAPVLDPTWPAAASS